MTDLTVRRAMRYFVATELVAIVIIILGSALEQNVCIISFGLLLVMSGLVFLTYAGNIKAQERMIEAIERAHQEQGISVDEIDAQIPDRGSDEML